MTTMPGTSNIFFRIAAGLTLVFCIASCSREFSEEYPGTELSFAPVVDSGSTRAAHFQTQEDLQDLGSFDVIAWNSDGSCFLPAGTEENATVSFNAESGRWTLDGPAGKAPLWKHNDVKTFYASANLPSGATASSVDASCQTFNYPAINVDANDQKDALLGFYMGNGDRDGDGKSDGVARIGFIHPMASVVFRQGDMKGVCSIKSISIDGVYDGGSAEITYSYKEYDAVEPLFDWGESLAATTSVSQSFEADYLPGEGNVIGVPFILFPQNFSSSPVTIKAVVSKLDGSEKEITAELTTGEWKEGKINTYVIGSDINTYVYNFSSVSSAVFTNTTSASTSNLTITSNRQADDGTLSNVEWKIKSVQVAGEEEQIIDNTSFSGIEGLSGKVGSGKFELTAAARKSSSVYTHDYWINKDGISGDTEGTGWSPKDWSDRGIIDLSYFDFKTETDRASMSTANCYVIRHAGHYKLPLVYGNAVKNGSVNVESYVPDATSGGSYRLVNFVNSEGKALSTESDAFIENNENCGGEDLKCAVVWQDHAVVLANLSIVGDIAGTYDISNVRYLQFDVLQDAIRQNNALICIYRDKEGGTDDQYDEGEAIWSWHIWTTNDPALIGEPIHVTSLTPRDYGFFPIHCLGWINSDICLGRKTVRITLAQSISEKETVITVSQPETQPVTHGAIYQWGRKDPIFCVPNASPAEGSHTTGSGAPTIAKAISTPGTRYGSSCNQLYLNLWMGKESSLTDVEQDRTSKTIYDPSPVGYQVPTAKAYRRFIGNSFVAPGTYPNGFAFYTTAEKSEIIIFYKSYTWYNSLDPSWALFWTATPTNVTTAYYFYAGNSMYSERNYDADCINPVKELE